MGDLIDRQAAIDALNKLKIYRPLDSDRYVISDCLNKIVNLPSAQPERKTGVWESTDDGWDGEYFVCSVCGCPWTLIEGSPEDNGMNFCPNCGADMRGKKHETD